MKKVIHISRPAWKVSPGADAFFWKECKHGGFIVIRWEDIGCQTFDSIGELKTIYHKCYPERPPGAIGKDCWTIWDFVKRIKRGDIVLANKGQSKIEGIGTVISEPYYDENKIPLRQKRAYNYEFTRREFSCVRDVAWALSFPDEGIIIPKQKDWLSTIRELNPAKSRLILRQVEQTGISLRMLRERHEAVCLRRGLIPYQFRNLHDGRTGVVQVEIDLDRTGRARDAHEQVLSLLARKLGNLGIAAEESDIDLTAVIKGARFIFEAKTIGSANFRSQLRDAIAKLLEYSYLYFLGQRTEKCIVFDREPPRIPGFNHSDYIERVLGMFVLWKSGRAKFQGGPKSRQRLSILCR